MKPHVCDCPECAGISRACMRNSIVLGLALWAVLIGVLWGALKVFG